MGKKGASHFSPSNGIKSKTKSEIKKGLPADACDVVDGQKTGLNCFVGNKHLWWNTSLNL